MQIRPKLVKQISHDNLDVKNYLDYLVEFFESDNPNLALMKFLTKINAKLHCVRLFLGVRTGKKIKLLAISDQTTISQKSQLASQVETVMFESLDQGTDITYPDGQLGTVKHFHENFAKQYHYGKLLTLHARAMKKSEVVLVAAYANDEDCQAHHGAILKDLLQVITPYLSQNQYLHKSIQYRFSQILQEQQIKLFGPKHYKHKTLAALLGMLFIILCTVPIEYRVGSDAILEGKIQRVITAPIDGYIESTRATAGDIVKTNQAMAKLNDDDLELKRSKLTAQYRQLSHEYRNALAKHERSEVGILLSKKHQTKAELDLVDQQLARLSISAPFDGVVVEGDLEQSLGSPIEKGDVLFKIAPLDSYRIILKVSEADIANITTGDQGNLLLAAFPNQKIPIEILRITPISVAEGGMNYFRVEAQLLAHELSLRPGMKGIAKINVGKRVMIWILTHRIFDWMRLTLWKW